MADFSKDPTERYRPYFAPLNKPWAQYWLGWITAANIGIWFEENRLVAIGLIALAIVYVRGLKERGDYASADLPPAANQQPPTLQTPTPRQAAQPPDKPIRGIRYVLRSIALWLFLVLLFLLIFNFFHRSLK